MECIRYTLIADGSSDKALMNIIKWLLDDLHPTIPNKGTFGDFRNLQTPPKKGDVKMQIKYACQLYPFDILFYHRDAKSNKTNIIEERITEIKKQLDQDFHSKTVFIIPIKMLENWLLLDEVAIKKAAGNRNYGNKITLPSISTLENLPDPKLFLQNLLKNVSGLKSRQLKNFNVQQAVHLVAENINDFGSLRQLNSFKKFEMDLKLILNNLIE